MNWKAIRQTLIPTKSDLLFLLGMALLSVIMVAFGAAIAGVSIAIWFGMVYLFGEYVANFVINSLVICVFVWLLVGWPLYDRYVKFASRSED